MGVGLGLYVYDVAIKHSRSLSHLLMSSCDVVVVSNGNVLCMMAFVLYASDESRFNWHILPLTYAISDFYIFLFREHLHNVNLQPI